MISNNGNWHTQEMARIAALSEDALIYTMNDCAEAIEANPENPKNGQYMDTIHYCGMEMKKKNLQRGAA